MSGKDTSAEHNSHNRAEPKTDAPNVAATESRLMPKGYYEQKYPWFGSQIRYTIDVIRYTIREYKRRKSVSSKVESE